MLQFFDDLPEDRWAAFVHVERLVREHHRTEHCRRYVQMVLIAAFELKLRILPEWQSEFGLLYRVADLGLNQDDNFEQFDRDLAAVFPKIQWLADQRKAPRGTEPEPFLDITNYRGPDLLIKALGDYPTMGGTIAIKTGKRGLFVSHSCATTTYRASIPPREGAGRDRPGRRRNHTTPPAKKNRPVKP